MENTTKVSSDLAMIEQESYVCSLKEYTPETDKPDGCQLEVVDETTHKVVKYCLAYNGFWNER